MPKLIPVADALSKPFWDAVNQRRLILQHCDCVRQAAIPAATGLPGLRLGRRSDVERGRGKRPYRELHRDRGWPPQPAHARSAL